MCLYSYTLELTTSLIFTCLRATLSPFHRFSPYLLLYSRDSLFLFLHLPPVYLTTYALFLHRFRGFLVRASHRPSALPTPTSSVFAFFSCPSQSLPRPVFPAWFVRKAPHGSRGRISEGRHEEGTGFSLPLLFFSF